MNFQSFSGEELTEPPPQTPPRAQSQALPSILERFASSVWAAPSIHPSNMFDTPSPNRGVLDQTRAVFPKPQLSGYTIDLIFRSKIT